MADASDPSWMPDHLRVAAVYRSGRPNLTVIPGNARDGAD